MPRFKTTLGEPEKDFHKGPLRVFVMGCSRGGTTVTQRLVAERLGLATLPETRFFANMIGNVEARMFPNTARPMTRRRRISSALREYFGLSTGMALLSVPGIEPIAGTKWAPFARMAALFVARMDGLAAQAQANGWLEKTPIHVHYAPQIARLVPGAWMIHILRDAEETVGSIRDAAVRFRDPWALIYDRVERDVDNWNASVAASAAMVGQPRQIFVSYEAMTANPAKVMDQIARVIGGETLARVSHPQPAGSVLGADSAVAGLTSSRDQHWKQAAVSGVVQTAKSKWIDALSAAERDRAGGLIRPVPQNLLTAQAAFLAAAMANEDGSETNGPASNRKATAP